MLSFWHTSLLVIMALMWKVRPMNADMDICDLTSSGAVSMFCSCATFGSHTEITCYIYGDLDSSHNVWESFESKKDTVVLKLISRLPYQLTFIPAKTLKSLPALETLEIRESNLGALPSGAVANLPKLANLSLHRNEITALERHSIANLPKLKKLTLTENYLTEILADSFVGLDELELLSLDTNNISRIEACAFCNLHNLKELELWRNSITDLTEHTFRGLRYVSNLDLFNNKISVLNDNVFQAMPKLRELNLKNNLIHYISPRTFDGLNQLSALYLSNNQLKSLLEDMFEQMPKLASLDLSNNHLETLTARDMRGLRNALADFFSLSIRGNPLKCSCDFSWVPSYAKKAASKMFVREITQMMCRTPDGEEQDLGSLNFKNCSVKKPEKKVTQPAFSVSTTKQPVLANPTHPSKIMKEAKILSKGSVPSSTVQPAQSAPASARSLTANCALIVHIVVLAVVWPP